MLRTAEEILKEVYDCEGDGLELQTEITLNPSVSIIKLAINDARKEALEELLLIALKYTDYGERVNEDFLKLLKELQ